MTNNFKKNILFAIIAIIMLALPTIVHSAKPFNVEVELSDKYANANPGTEVWFTMFLLNLDNTQRVDVVLNYDIINSANESIIHASKTVAIETQASFVASLIVPENTPPGDYTLAVLVTSSLGESTANASLKISEPEKDLRPYYYIGGAAALLIIILLLSKSGNLIRNISLKMRIHRIVRNRLKK